MNHIEIIATSVPHQRISTKSTDRSKARIVQRRTANFGTRFRHPSEALLKDMRINFKQKVLVLKAPETHKIGRTLRGGWVQPALCTLASIRVEVFL